MMLHMHSAGSGDFGGRSLAGQAQRFLCRRRQADWFCERRVLKMPTRGAAATDARDEFGEPSAREVSNFEVWRHSQVDQC